MDFCIVTVRVLNSYEIFKIKSRLTAKRRCDITVLTQLIHIKQIVHIFSVSVRGKDGLWLD